MAKNPSRVVVGDHVVIERNHRQILGKVVSIKRRRATILCEGRGWAYETHERVWDLLPCTPASVG